MYIVQGTCMISFINLINLIKEIETKISIGDVDLDE